jgi:hypothetical protein
LVVSIAGSGDCLQKQSLMGRVKNCRCFKRTVVVRTWEFYVIGERLPPFDMQNPQIYNQSLVDFGAHDET